LSILADNAAYAAVARQSMPTASVRQPPDDGHKGPQQGPANVGELYTAASRLAPERHFGHIVTDVP